MGRPGAERIDGAMPAEGGRLGGDQSSWVTL